ESRKRCNREQVFDEGAERRHACAPHSVSTLESFDLPQPLRRVLLGAWLRLLQYSRPLRDVRILPPGMVTLNAELTAKLIRQVAPDASGQADARRHEAQAVSLVDATRVNRKIRQTVSCLP